MDYTLDMSVMLAIHQALRRDLERLGRIAAKPDGDPGRPYWNAGPDHQGHGRYPLPSAYDGTGINPNTPF